MHNFPVLILLPFATNYELAYSVQLYEYKLHIKEEAYQKHHGIIDFLYSVNILIDSTPGGCIFMNYDMRVAWSE